MIYTEVDKRYTSLAETSCCLSCGGAINYSGAGPGEICIDLGSGRGTDAIRLAGSVGSEGFVYGVDISEGMIRKSVETAKRLNVENVRFLHGPLETIELGSETADLVISNCTINHSSCKQDVWNEVYRLLKKGGRFVVSDIYSLEPVPSEFMNDPVAVSECWAGSVTRSEYLAHLDNAGFTRVKIIEESAPYEKGKVIVASWTISGEK